MKNLTMNRTKAALAAASLATLLISPQAQAVDIIKANNTNNLFLTSSWVGGVVPTGSDVAVWDNTVAGTNTTILGADLAFQGIRIADPGGIVTVNAGNTLSLGSAGIDMSAANQDFRLRSNVALTANQNWTVAAGRELEIGETGSSITGNFDVNLSGAGLLSFRNTGMFTDAATNLVLSGGITLVSTNARILTSEVTFNGNTNFGQSAVARQTISLQGSTVVNAGTHDVTLRDTVPTDVALTFSGASYSLSGPGTLRFVNGNASGIIGINIGATGAATATVSADLTVGNNVRMTVVTGGSLTAASDLTVESGGFLTLNNGNQTIGSLSGAGTVERSGSGTFALTIDGGVGTATSTFSGVAQDTGAVNLGITKAGSTTQVLSGPNTYTGQTQINGGTLLINGTHIEASAVTANGYNSATNGHFRVASGATFGGSGRISGNNSQSNSNMVLVQSGGTLAPGSNGIGTLTLDGVNISGAGAEVLNMAAGAEFAFQLAGNGGTPDRVDFWNYAGGDFLLNANAINLSLSGPIVAGNYTVDIIRFFSNSGTTTVASGIASGLVLGTLDANISGASITFGTDVISIQYTAIPEPTTALLLLGGLGMTALLRRRRA